MNKQVVWWEGRRRRGVSPVYVLNENFIIFEIKRCIDEYPINSEGR